MSSNSKIDGIYALGSFDGAPLAPRDLSALGLSPGGSGFAMGTCDKGTAFPILGSEAFLGHLDDRVAVAASFGLDANAPPATVVCAALARYGESAPAHLPGEWSFVSWDARTATLTLLASDTLRDALFFATDGRRVAVAPDLAVLQAIEWIDATPGIGMLQHFGRTAIRDALGDRTSMRGVRWTGAGSRVTIGRGIVTGGIRAPLPEPRPWEGTFVEAIEELDALLRRIVSDQMGRHANAAVLLSGGLDSSLIAAFATAVRPPSTRLFALTSAAHAGSGLLDEVEFAQAVADQTGLDVRAIVPNESDDAYLPSGDMYFRLDQPPCSPRHYLYDALYRAAEGAGADGVFDGCDGESNITGHPDETGWRHRLRAMREWRRSRTASLQKPATVQRAFHVRLSAAAIEFASVALRDELDAPAISTPRRLRNGLWGYPPAISKNLRQTSAMHRNGLRQLAPFRDRRLVTLFAGMPYRFMTEGGLTRAPARALLAGKVPEHIRLRIGGRPFSPDYVERLRRHAPRARARLVDQQRAGAGEWLDLSWLDGALLRIGMGGDVPYDMMVEAQMTACAAAFLARWNR